MNNQLSEIAKTQIVKDYKTQHKLEDRKKRVQQFRELYPDMITLVVQKHPSANISSLKRPLFLVNQKMKFSDFKIQIKAKLLQLSPQETLFFYCGNNLIYDSVSLQELYNKYKDREDEFLYLHYSDFAFSGK